MSKEPTGSLQGLFHDGTPTRSVLRIGTRRHSGIQTQKWTHLQIQHYDRRLLSVFIVSSTRYSNTIVQDEFPYRKSQTCCTYLFYPKDKRTTYGFRLNKLKRFGVRGVDILFLWLRHLSEMIIRSLQFRFQFTILVLDFTSFSSVNHGVPMKIRWLVPVEFLGFRINVSVKRGFCSNLTLPSHCLSVSSWTPFLHVTSPSLVWLPYSSSMLLRISITTT